MLLRISLLLALLLIVPPWVISNHWLRHRLHRFLLFLPNALLLIGVGAFAINENYSPQAALWKGGLLTVILCLAVPETLLAFFLAVSVLFRRGSLAKRAVRGAGIGLAVLAFGLLLTGFTYGYRHLTKVPFTYTSARIPPAFDGYRIAVISDLHVGTFRDEKLVGRIVDSVNSTHPDAIFFVGDLVNYQSEELTKFLPQLRRLHARDGVFSVMGNHDYMTYHRWPHAADSLADIRRLQEMQRTMGWRLLVNEHAVLHRGNDSIAIVGVGNEGKPPFPQEADLPRATRGLSPTAFRLLLTHDPTHWQRDIAGKTTVPLTFSGHTHGMQLRFLGWSPAAWFFPEWGGAYEQNGQTLFVTQGIGEVLLPFRLGAWPEIVVCELRRDQPSPSVDRE